MSHEILEERVGKLEGGFASLRTEVAVLSRDVGELKSQGHAVLAGINELKQNEAGRPVPLGWRTIGATASAIAAMAIIVWWLIEHSPAVIGLDKRLTKLDDPDTGRVQRLEKDAGWNARVFQNH